MPWLEATACFTGIVITSFQVQHPNFQLRQRLSTVNIDPVAIPVDPSYFDRDSDP